MAGPITIHSDLSEQLRYNNPDYPLLYARQGELKDYGYAAVNHWHQDLEYIYVNEGIMDYFVNGKTVRMRSGEGIFVNSSRMHYGFSKENYDCRFICVVIHPQVFTQGTQAGRDYMGRKFSANNPDYIFLSPSVPWQETLLEELVDFYQLMQDAKKNYLKAIAAAVQIVELTGDHIPDSEKSESDNRGVDSFLQMTSFLAIHYPEKISLDEIAAAGAVSRSKACRLFQRFVQQTPGQYLQQYRIEKSAVLLRDTNLPVSEISWRCGFSSPSYYTSVFREMKGRTPKEYRSFLRN